MRIGEALRVARLDVDPAAFTRPERYRRRRDVPTRDPLEPCKRLTPSPVDPEDALDDEFNDDIPFF